MKRHSHLRILIAGLMSTTLVAGQVFAQQAVTVASAPTAPAVISAPAAPELVSAAPAAPAATGDEWQQEFAVWQAAAEGNSIEEYQNYLAAYPAGKFASIAQSRIVKLTATQDEASRPEGIDETKVSSLTEDAPKLMAGTPADEAMLLTAPSTRREVQGRLTSLGFNTGGTDGVMGARSRTAISQWQAAVSAPVTGYLAYDQLAKLRTDSEPVYQSWLASRPKPAPRRYVSRGPVLVGRVRDNSADAAIALGVMGLAAGIIGGVAISGHHGHGGHGFRHHR